MVKNLPAIQETWVLSQGQEDPLEKGIATHSKILAWRAPWTEEPGGLESMGSQTVEHDWVAVTHTGQGLISSHGPQQATSAYEACVSPAGFWAPAFRWITDTYSTVYHRRSPVPAPWETVRPCPWALVTGRHPDRQTYRNNWSRKECVSSNKADTKWRQRDFLGRDRGLMGFPKERPLFCFAPGPPGGMPQGPQRAISPNPSWANPQWSRSTLNLSRVYSPKSSPGYIAESLGSFFTPTQAGPTN